RRRPGASDPESDFRTHIIERRRGARNATARVISAPLPPVAEPRMQFASYPSLNNAVVFITGGASGIGEAMVRAFAAQGSHVGLIDIAADQGRALANEL